MIRGFQYMADVSSNNGESNIAAYSRAGHAVIMIKATEGISYVNPFHLRESDTAHEFGLTVVHYHYCRPDHDIGQEITLFRNIYNKSWRRGDYVCFDIEEKGLDLSYANSILSQYYLQTKREPILYLSHYWLNSQLKGVKVPGKRLLVADWSSYPVNVDRSKYVLWARQYTNGTQGPEPRFYTGIGQCDGSIVTAGVARALYLRKLTTRKRK